jgi:hypothetical protein
MISIFISTFKHDVHNVKFIKAYEFFTIHLWWTYNLGQFYRTFIVEIGK